MIEEGQEPINRVARRSLQDEQRHVRACSPRRQLTSFVAINSNFGKSNFLLLKFHDSIPNR